MCTYVRLLLIWAWARQGGDTKDRGEQNMVDPCHQWLGVRSSDLLGWMKDSNIFLLLFTLNREVL